MKTHIAIADVGQVAQRQGIISNDNNRTSLKYSRVRATDMFFSSDGETRHHPRFWFPIEKKSRGGSGLPVTAVTGKSRAVTGRI
jgi:hypothetical protein